jgi:predicted PurR-regulated permease PerM
MASLILSASMENVIAWLEKKKIPRIVSTILVYIVLVCLIAGLMYIILPPLFQNVLSLAGDLPTMLKSNATSRFFKNYLPFINNKSLLTNVFTTDNTVNYVGNLVRIFQKWHWACLTFY